DKMTNKHLIYLLPIIVMLTSSCSSLGLGTGTPVPTVSTRATDAGPDSQNTLTPTEPATPEPTAEPEPSPTPEPAGSQYWTVYEDPVHGFRFALPCYWRIAFPEPSQYAQGSGVTYHAYNYAEDYPLNFPRSFIPEEYGWTKVDFGIINVDFLEDFPGTSLEEFVIYENSGGDGEIVEVVDLEIGGRPAIDVSIYYADRDITGRYYLIELNGERFMRLSAAPSPERLAADDLQGILRSITFDPAAEVVLPAHTPAAPPPGLAAPCIPEYAEAVEIPIELSEANTECGLDSFKSLEDLTTTIQQYLQDRNTGGLRWEYLIHDPIVIGYWGSEGAVRSPDEFATELANSLYAAGSPGGMTFTTDRSQFPPLAGTPPERLFDPSINFVEIIYSEGWGVDKQGAALLYFAEDECGGYYWYGLAYSMEHFDK
ncbi:MAG: hypothetical protein R3335_06750, partial [Anaerolineales bacterium]|nr:hypothetical protein [Anaerolineales bacterium]